MNTNGYIAISSVLVIAAVVLILGTSVALLSVNTIQSSLATKKGIQALDLVEGCVENALLILNETNSIPSAIVLPEGSCVVTTVSHTGNDWMFDVEATQEDYTKIVRIEASRNATITINSWTEQ